jgi:hypothetical protein
LIPKGESLPALIAAGRARRKSARDRESPATGFSQLGGMSRCR